MTTILFSLSHWSFWPMVWSRNFEVISSPHLLSPISLKVAYFTSNITQHGLFLSLTLILVKGTKESVFGIIRLSITHIVMTRKNEYENVTISPLHCFHIHSIHGYPLNMSQRSGSLTEPTMYRVDSHWLQFPPCALYSFVLCSTLLAISCYIIFLRLLFTTLSLKTLFSQPKTPNFYFLM